MNEAQFTIKFKKWNVIGQINYADKLPSPVVILLHGLTNNTADCPVNKDMYRVLPSMGYSVLQFDFFGSGKSDGLFKDKTLGDLHLNFLEIMRFVRKNKKFTKIGVVGKSVIGIFPIIADDKRISSIALLSTAIRPTIQFYRIWDNNKGYMKLSFAKGLNAKGDLILSQKFFTELENIENKVLINIPKIKNVIHFHGTKDFSCSFDQGHFHHLRINLPEPKRSIIIEDVSHRYEGKEDFVINEIVKWFDKFLKGKK